MTEELTQRDRLDMLRRMAQYLLDLNDEDA